MPLALGSNETATVRNTMFRAWIVLCLLLAAESLFAQGGPPMRTDDPGTPGPGNWEINLALTSERRPAERVFEAPLADINYGVGERLQLKVEIPWVIRGADQAGTKSGLGNSLFGVKWRFYDDQRHQLQISTYPQVELNNPTHSVERGLVERGARLLLPLEVATRLGPVDVNPELGYWFSQRGKGEFFIGTAVGRQITNRVEVIGEIYSIGSSDGRDTTFGLGTRIPLKCSIRAILMAGRSLTGAQDQPTFIGYGGLQFVLERHKGANGEAQGP